MAIRRGAHQEAEWVLSELRDEVEALWAAADSREERQEIASEITALLEWARQTVVSARSHTQAKLIRLNRQKIYLVANPRRREPVQVDG